MNEHLAATSERAEQFAAPFAEGWGRLAGLWHDAGKYQKAFQEYLKAPRDHTGPKLDHSAVGALLAWGKRAGPLTFVIAGHHGGLPNKQDLLGRLDKKRDLLADAREAGLPETLENQPTPFDPPFPPGTALALWTRFLFSALVNADFLDTESFFQSCERDIPPARLEELAERLDAELDGMTGRDSTPMNLLRRRVLDNCREAAILPPGFFSLTVPTGGGKTLSSLSTGILCGQQHDSVLRVASTRCSGSRTLSATVNRTSRSPWVASE